jgi:hypothetical protein
MWIRRFVSTACAALFIGSLAYQAWAAAPAKVAAPAATSGHSTLPPRQLGQTKGVDPYDQYYGVYVSGNKVGWMRSRLRLLPQPVLSTELHAKVSGMGKVSNIDLSEERVYVAQTDLGSGSLESLRFTQQATTGRVTVQGRRLPNGQMELAIEAGGETRKQSLEVNERLADALASADLTRAGKVGATFSAVHLDPSLQKLVRIEYRVVSLQRRNLAGVDTKAVKIASTYPDLGVSEVAWLDGTGKVLESQVGGFFVARLEPPDVAKRLDYAQDLLVSAVVRAPRVLMSPANIGRLSLRLSGFGAMTPPASSRQAVHRDGDLVQVVLVKDALPGRSSLLQSPNEATPAVAEALRPTPFIQSDSPELIRVARAAIGKTQDAFTAATRLSRFVYKYVHSEYVPAYSNALEVYHSARGDCTEYSVLFVALARAVGLPARVAVGIAYWPPGDGFGWHAWGEVYIEGRWIAVDPTWNQPIADATHLKLAGDGPAEQAQIVMLLGKLKIVDMQAK